MPEEKRTVIENGTEIDGSIKSERPITLSGSIKGQVSAPSLDVTPGGTVNGTVKVSQFSCKGEVGGEVMAEVVELAGRVCDGTVIKAKTLDVKLAQSDGGVQVSFGNCELQVGDLPAKSSTKTSGSTSESHKVVASSQSVPAEVTDAVAELMK